jgi:hypothetical protein
MTTPETPIETYLDALLGELRGPAPYIRRMLAETETHLREAADAVEAGGPGRVAAERVAVERFGAPGEVARAANKGAGVRTLRHLAVPGVLAAVRLGAVGLVAVGVTGVASAGLRAMAGSAYVYADPSGVRASAAACAHWMAAQPAAHTCAQAAALENASDTLVLRGAAGILGVLVLAVLALALRRGRGRRLPRALPSALEPTIGAALFLAAGVAMLALGLSGALVTGAAGTTSGAGQWLASGVVAIAASLAYAALLVRRVSAPIPTR